MRTSKARAGLENRATVTQALEHIRQTARQRKKEWNKLGMEYTLMWRKFVTFYFLIHGGGRYSLDHLIGREF